jgi:hypothetical protein
MPINPKCFICKKELNEFGGILLLPPDKQDRVKKLHVCIKCCKMLIKNGNRLYRKKNEKLL